MLDAGASIEHVPDADNFSTLAGRVLYAAQVVQEARGQDAVFAAVYWESLHHEGVGLCGVLADLTRRLRATENGGLPLP